MTDATGGPSPAGAIEDEDGMCAGGDLAADRVQMQRPGIGGWHDQAGGDATLRERDIRVGT